MLAGVLGCAENHALGARDVRIDLGRAPGHREMVVTQFEMQQAIERFTGDFLDNIVGALEPLERSGRVELRREALRRVLVYASSALDITSGPLPEVNVLDMVVFIRLSKASIERHWVPEVFGSEANALLVAFAESEDRAWQLASKILDVSQRAKLAQLIEAWERVNPGQVRVEMIRFDEFSARAGKVAEELQEKAAGLLGTAKEATLAVDRGLLLAERAMFLAHRLPFLMRLQARVGAGELVADSLGQLGSVEALLERATEGREVLPEISELTRELVEVAREARLTIEAAKPLLGSVPARDDIRSTLDASNQLADKGLSLLREARALAPADGAHMVALIEERADHLLRRALWMFGLLGGGWVVLFWGGYYTVQRLTKR
jgi:hypothetical protein